MSASNRVGMPRTDLSVTVKGVPVKPGFALGSYAAFKQVGDPKPIERACSARNRGS